MYAGLACGFAAGLFQDALSSGVLGVLAFTRSSIGYWLGWWLQRRSAVLGILGWSLSVLVAALVQDLLAAMILLQGSQLELGRYFLQTIIPSSFYTAVVALLWTLAPLGERSRQPLKVAPVRLRKMGR
jgi:hypothetical protein